MYLYTPLFQVLTQAKGISRKSVHTPRGKKNQISPEDLENLTATVTAEVLAIAAAAAIAPFLL